MPLPLQQPHHWANPPDHPPDPQGPPQFLPTFVPMPLPLRQPPSPGKPHKPTPASRYLALVGDIPEGEADVGAGGLGALPELGRRGAVSGGNLGGTSPMELAQPPPSGPGSGVHDRLCRRPPAGAGAAWESALLGAGWHKLEPPARSQPRPQTGGLTRTGAERAQRVEQEAWARTGPKSPGGSGRAHR